MLHEHKCISPALSCRDTNADLEALEAARLVHSASTALSTRRGTEPEQATDASAGATLHLLPGVAFVGDAALGTRMLWGAYWTHLISCICTFLP